jgi:solute carrier family 36 (proton-coupled amino acid transporter)
MGTLLLVLPVLLVTQIRHMRHLVPLSLSAFCLLVLAMGTVCSLCATKFYGDESLPPAPVFREGQVLPFFASVVYCFEGIGIILPIEGAMIHPQRFSYVLIYAMLTVRRPSMIYI